jgi:hypothetical protein
MFAFDQFYALAVTYHHCLPALEEAMEDFAE